MILYSISSFFYHSFLKSCSALGNLLLKQNTSTETNLQLSLFAVSPQMSAFPCLFFCLLSPTSHTHLPLPDFCLFCPASKSKGEKPKNLLMRRGGQRERLVTSQWVRSEVGGSQWMSDTVPHSQHTLDKKYWEPFLRQASFWALCTCRWPRPVPALQTLSRKTVQLAEKQTANYNTLRQALFQIWAQNFGVSGWWQGMSSQEVWGRLQSTVIRSYLGRHGHTEGRGTEGQFCTQTCEGPEDREISTEALTWPCSHNHSFLCIASSLRL